METNRNSKKKNDLSKQKENENENIKLSKEEREKFDRENSINIIDLDIERTFPYLNIFKHNSPLSDDLREILRAFVISRPDIGYVQGLSFIAGMLILNMDKYKAFISMMKKERKRPATARSMRNSRQLIMCSKRWAFPEIFNRKKI